MADNYDRVNRASLVFFLPRKVLQVTVRILRWIFLPRFQSKLNLCKFAAWIVWRFLICLVLVVAVFERLLPFLGNTIVPPRSARPPISPPGLSLVDTASSTIPYSVDVVFIHGLGSFPDSTWQKKTDGDRNVSWVRDLLPNDVEMARLFYFNYDSTIYNDAPQKQLEDFGADLLSAFRRTTLRSTKEEQSRPIIFLCHSYGGLVVKEALVQALQNPTQNLRVLYNVKGIIFLGTPHLGTKYSEYTRKVAAMLDPLSSNPDIFLPLAVDSPLLVQLHQEFLDGFGNIDIVNIWETRKQIILPWPVSRIPYRVMIVSKHSATFSAVNTINDNIDTDHSGLNKYNSAADPGYVKIVFYMTSMIRKISRERRERKYSLAGVLNRPQLLKPTSHFCSSEPKYIVKPTRTRTYIERPKLMEQLEKALDDPLSYSDTPMSVALWGIAGGGKTELALRYAWTHRQRYDPVIFVNAQNMDTAIESFTTAFQVLDLDFPTHPMDDWRKARQSGKSPALNRNDWIAYSVLEELTNRKENQCEWLLVLNNIGGESVHWVQQIMPKGRRGSIILTSVNENIKNLDINHDIWVDMLERDEAKSLLLQRATLHYPEPQRLTAIENLETSQGKAISEILDCVGRHAIVVNSAGSYIGQNDMVRNNLSIFLDYFDTASFGLSMHYAAGNRNLATVLEMSWQLLNSSNYFAAGLLTLLSNLNGDSIEDRLFLEGSLRLSTAKGHSWIPFILEGFCGSLGILLLNALLCYLIRICCPKPDFGTKSYKFVRLLFVASPTLLMSLGMVMISIIRVHRIATGHTVKVRYLGYTAEDFVILEIAFFLFHLGCLAEAFLPGAANRFLYLVPMNYSVLTLLIWIFVKFLETRDSVMHEYIKQLLLRLDFPHSTVVELSKIVGGIQREEPQALGWQLLIDIAWKIFWSAIVQILLYPFSILISVAWQAFAYAIARWIRIPAEFKTWKSLLGWGMLWLASTITEYFLLFILGFAVALTGLLDWEPFHPVRVHKSAMTSVNFPLAFILQLSSDGSWNRLPYSTMMSSISSFALIHRNTDQSYLMHPLVQWWTNWRLTPTERRAWLKLSELLITYVYGSDGCWADYACQKILIPHLIRLGSLDAMLAEDRYWTLKAILERLYRSLKFVQQKEIEMQIE